MSKRARTPRIGPAMRAAAREVAANPGTRKMPVADAIGPHGSRKFGYAAVSRAMKAGLIEDRGGDSRGYRLHLTDAGEDAI